MVRRFLRTFTPLGLLVLLAAAVLSQYWMSLVRVPICLLYCGRDGIGIERRADWRWSAEFFDRPDRAFSNFFALPSTYIAHGNPGIFLPWWLLLTCWLMLTVITWRITRRKAPHRFSVGPGAVQTKTIPEKIPLNPSILRTDRYTYPKKVLPDGGNGAVSGARGFPVTVQFYKTRTSV